MSEIDKGFDKIRKKMEQQKKNAEQIKVESGVNRNTNINVNNKTNKNADVNINTNSDNSSIFVLEKKAKESDELKRQTYYLNDQLIQLIDDYSQQSGYNKSELVRIALQHFFNNLEIHE